MDFYRACIFPLFRLLTPERAHHLALHIAPLWMGHTQSADSCLQQTVWGLPFWNPIGLAAGFDKDGKALHSLSRFGFGFLEVGTVTPRPQAGNAKPRLFRSIADQAIINRMGFNNQGMDQLARRLRAPRSFCLGINIGKNKDSPDDIEDYQKAAQLLSPQADYITVNISSPNTPGLRSLQARERLEPLLAALKPLTSPKPLLVKIAPDLSPTEQEAIAELALMQYCDGIIIGNTTLSRPASLDPVFAREIGGLSGKPLMELSTNVLKNFYRLTKGKVPLIGVGGITDAQSAYLKIRAGASLVQIYSALIFQGPGFIKKILRELPSLLRSDGFTRITEAIGADHRDRS